MFEDWLTGFVDGEGCFYISMEHRRMMHFSKPRVRIGFSVSNQDMEVLKRIRKFFGFGRISPSRNGVYIYLVRALDDLQHIASFFEKHPLLVKAGDFKLWTCALLMVKEGRHLTLDGMKEMRRMQYRLHPNSVRPKHNFSIPSELYCECGKPIKQGHHH